MWHKMTRSGLGIFVKVFDYTLRSLHQGNMRAFARHLEAQSPDGIGPSSTTLGGLKTTRGAAKASSATLAALDGQLLIPLTRQYFSLLELQAVVSGQIPFVRFYSRDSQGAFAEKFIAEIMARGESIQDAARATGMSFDRLERLLALNGFGARVIESLDLVGHYSSDMHEQRDLAALMDLHYDLPAPSETRKIMEGNGNPSAFAPLDGL